MCTSDLTWTKIQFIKWSGVPPLVMIIVSKISGFSDSKLIYPEEMCTRKFQVMKDPSRVCG